MATAGYSGARPRGPLAGSTREAAQATAPGFGGALRALLDAGAGALRGSTRATLGLPGDLESLVRLLTGGETVLPTSEDLDRMLPGIEGHTAQTFDKVGEFVPLPVPPKAVGALTRAGYANLTAPGDMALQSQRGAVRLKGGNFNDARLAGYLGDTLNVHTPEYFDLIGDIPREGREGAVGDWGRKQLKNYLRKDLGSPTDPLLQVEKEYPNLHLPEDQMWNPQEALRQRRMLSNSANREVDHYLNRHNELSGGAELTPWGYNSDQQLHAVNPDEYALDLIGGEAPEDEALGILKGLYETGDKYKWLQDAPPDTKIWGLVDPHTDDLGFNHVLDYLEAASKGSADMAAYGGEAAMRAAADEAGRIPGMRPPAWADSLRLYDAGLTLSPEQIARTSVADAVRKTAQWNELLKNSGVAGDPDLARGIVRTHKEYPEEGMKWVELGKPEFKPFAKDSLPEGYEFRSEVVPDDVMNESLRGKPLYGVRRKDESRPTSTGDWHNHPGLTEEEALANFNEWAARDYGKKELSAGLNAEGKAMGHCVGGYCDEVANRGTKIYSLRDKNGNPHVTVEVRPQKKITGWKDEHTPLREDDIELPSDIIQIKGKQNAAPVEKYLPYVQDFVKGGKWGRVGDLRNTGLVEHKGAYHTKEELWKAVEAHERFQRIKALHEERGYPRGSAGFDMLNREGDPGQMLDYLDDPKFWDHSGEERRYAEGGPIRQHKFLATLKSIREEV